MAAGLGASRVRDWDDRCDFRLRGGGDIFLVKVSSDLCCVMSMGLMVENVEVWKARDEIMGGVESLG
ncbi:hypothetical protein M501DRAFT_1001297 [Patellaria atrata CBS 101060]|uniref:Uncharacterized protein n=1 Tax=Patellaria atrata CBS 101060 TaxID=1346257 RepID=A0A9P4VNA4_9PEZI|nr:hypothetical protein M501DRAFT_1001297 [Patellaria atrata CBS 101060]